MIQSFAASRVLMVVGAITAKELVTEVELTGEQRPHVVGLSGTIPVECLSLGKPRKTKGLNQVVSRSARRQE